VDLNDGSLLNIIVRQVSPDEIYNLGPQSHVRVSFDIPERTAEMMGLGAVGCSRQSGRSASAGFNQ
jgi:GDPmannose 4,6-dehydratase